MSTETNSTRFFYSLYYIVGKGCLCVCSFGACNLLFYVELQPVVRCGGGNLGFEFQLPKTQVPAQCVPKRPGSAESFVSCKF